MEGLTNSQTFGGNNSLKRTCFVLDTCEVEERSECQCWEHWTSALLCAQADQAIFGGFSFPLCKMGSFQFLLASTLPCRIRLTLSSPHTTPF